tara:strand:+ start:3967 stop:4281 length:315 start_codon:yes stop_codon:yes gene_type:complete
MTPRLDPIDTPRQSLPHEAYVNQDWFERERHELFCRTWGFVGTVHDFKEAGEYQTVQAGVHTLAVVRGSDGKLRGFHNICRHRRTELLEGHGNAGPMIMCPYHR